MASLLDPRLGLQRFDLVPEVAGVHGVSQSLTADRTEEWMMPIYAERFPPFGPQTENVHGPLIDRDGSALLSLVGMDRDKVSVPIDVGRSDLERGADSHGTAVEEREECSVSDSGVGVIAGGEQGLGFVS